MMVTISAHCSLAMGASSVLRFEPTHPFRTRRLVLSCKGGPMLDLGRFYAVRARRTKSQRRARIRALLSASTAMKIAQGADVDPFVILTNVHVGSLSQLASDAQIPVEVFAPAAMMGDISLDPASAGTVITATVHNLDGRAFDVRAALLGESPRVEPADTLVEQWRKIVS